MTKVGQRCAYFHSQKKRSLRGLGFMLSSKQTHPQPKAPRISARHRSSPVTSTTSVDPATETTTTHKLDLTGVDDPKA
ncbi:uncharacterized protein LOC123502385 isoform X3 [Portunus trituberculatus]|uniref:uncharacterized protein LOC123502385 isoform X3 n=1 Tax=Portunus trituberculatus TaxID=210409 RepID=UPI001E1CDD61|nr:uncharacterized protein LOC123502385 isoform X3 [Portunus trituberculatus]